MLTRIAPTRAVANWTTTHSALFGAQMPDAVAFRDARCEQAQSTSLDLGIELRVRPADSLCARDERLAGAVLRDDRVPHLADRLAAQRHIGDAVLVRETHSRLSTDAAALAAAAVSDSTEMS